MLSRIAKEELVKEFNETFKANPSLFVLEYKGLTVKEIELVRRNLKQADGELKIIKNTLLKIASKETDVEKLHDLFSGPTAIALVKGEPSPVAKVIAETKKEFPAIVLKGGMVDGIAVTVEEIEEISKLPSKEVLVAQILGLLSSPISNLLGALKQTQTKVLDALGALKEKKEKEENSH